MSQNRLDYLDMAKGIGIFFVILGHIEFIQESTLRWIFSFHMPLFFVIGGIIAFHKKEQEQSPADYLKRKFCGILIPYISFSLILLSMNLTGYLLKNSIFNEIQLIRQFVDSITGYGIHILWFLPAYCFANLIFYLLNRYQRPVERNLWIAILTALALLTVVFFGLNQYNNWDCTLGETIFLNLLIVVLRSVLAVPFLLFGWYFALFLPRIPQRFKGCGIIFLFAGSFFALKLDILDLHYLYIHPLHYLIAALTICGILLLTNVLPVIPVICWLGKHSLIIMCTHAAFYVIYYISLGLFFVKKFIPMTDPVFNLSTAFLVCLAEIPIICIFNRYFPHLLGKKK